MQSVKEFRAIAFGCQLGDVLIVSSNNLGIIQCRLKFHRYPIVLVEYVSKNALLSVCKGNHLIISRVAPDQPPTITINLSLGEQFDRVFKCEHHLIVAYQSGEF